jgi:16S rRNA (guanine527-N7)-methyltransferase
MADVRVDGNFQGVEILEEGLDMLCRDDSGALELIAPRRAEIVSLLCAYIAEIELHNPALGLVGTADRQELIRRHILDSLAPLGLFARLLKNCGRDQIPRVADVGSGAGLPGAPLAVAMPRVHFTLIERTGRRAGFLRGVQKSLALSNAVIVEDEMEKFAHNLITKKFSDGVCFDLVTFRAFRQFEPKIIRGLLRLCAADGVIAAYKGRREKIDADVAALENYFANHGDKSQMSSCEVIPCPTPLLAEERHILLIRSGCL